ncbi:DUF1403 family protein [Mesorhizobium sp. L48C026A00]|uniref:DUF1403 family protein n=1 Tax=Mesorhizobium sp. L48C026A00 TaxID=1287182 RepID=UPI00358DFE79
MLTGAFASAGRHGFGRYLGSWLADALLAQRLGWPHAVPLLGTQPGPGGSLRGVPPKTTSLTQRNQAPGGERVQSLLVAQAHAALQAIDLSAELGRRAERLSAIAPKLRAKGADLVVDRLLNDDALVASRGDKSTGMSDLRTAGTSGVHIALCIFIQRPLVKPSRNSRFVVFNQVLTETSKSRSIGLNGTGIRPGRRRCLVLFDETRCVISDERGVDRVGIQDRAVHHWRSARRRLETTQCSSHVRGATLALVLLEIRIQRLLVRDSARSALPCTL